MSRKNPPTWFGWSQTCPTCGGAEIITARGRGIARMMGPRAPYTPGQRRLWDQIWDKWRPAMRAAMAYHDEDGVYHEPDLIGGYLLRAACRAEIEERVGPEDKGRGSIRVYWPQHRTWQKTLAWCPDPFHESRGRSSFRTRNRSLFSEEETSAPRRQRTALLSKDQRAAAAERRKAKARRHKERQAKR